jgi:hypothetical protein
MDYLKTVNFFSYAVFNKRTMIILRIEKVGDGSSADICQGA